MERLRKLSRKFLRTTAWSLKSKACPGPRAAAVVLPAAKLLRRDCLRMTWMIPFTMLLTQSRIEWVQETTPYAHVVDMPSKLYGL